MHVRAYTSACARVRMSLCAVCMCVCLCHNAPVCIHVFSSVRCGLSKQKYFPVLLTNHVNGFL